MEELKLFVGGYYDSRIFCGEEFEGKTKFDKTIETYTLSEVLKLGFIEPIGQWYYETYKKDWENTTKDEKIKAILEYSKDDEIAGMLYFDTEKQAENFKNNTIEEIEEIEKNSIYKGKEQDNEGHFREVYISK